MSITKKVIIIIGSMVIALMVAVFIFTENIFYKRFSILEDKNINQDMLRVTNALEKEESLLDAINTDWSAWDDTYTFVKKPNDEFITKNLMDDTFINLKVNFIIILDNQNNIKFEKGYDFNEGKGITVPKSLQNMISSNNFKLDDDTNSKLSGIIMLPEDPLLISCKPVITSTFKGPIVGKVIVAKYLDTQLVKHLSQVTELPITWFDFNTPKTKTNIAAIGSYNATGQKNIINKIDARTIVGYTIIKDINGSPRLVLKTTIPRNIYIEGEIGRRYFIILLSITCTTFTILILWLLTKYVVGPSARQKVLLDTIPCVVYFKDSNLRYIGGNKMFYDKLNISEKELIGSEDFDHFPVDLAEQMYNEDTGVLKSKLPILNKIINFVDTEGKSVWLSESKAPYFDKYGRVKGLVGISIDITEQKEAEERVISLAYTDQLTNLPNRIMFVNELNKHLGLNKDSQNPLCILYMDLDKFKLINDTLGHTVGDLFLQEVAYRLSSSIDKNSILARFSGDEFAILIPNVDKKQTICKLCTDILRTIKQPWQYNHNIFHITASIGISIYPTDGQDYDTLLKNADAAMYKAKIRGKNNFQFYKAILSDEALEELSLQDGLRQAIKNNEFVLHYQPQINIFTGKIVGVEALIRWNHPQLGLIYPNKFIPFAEENNLIIQIGEWVVRTACQQNKIWQNKGLAPIKVAVNISSKQFQTSNLITVIAEILKETSLDPKYLEVEITESITMSDPKKSTIIMNKLNKMGINLALDDFGTGYSSLMYLKNFPIDKIKIDKTFIDDIISKSADTSIVKSIISLSKNMDLQVIAEGVETIEQLEFLREHDCDEVQGYLFSKPIPADALEQMLKNNEQVNVQYKISKDA
ncbi:MAG: EAL domain-containing protein [Bacillota bacterium]|nr:EAL domain-containing protein [Bacillota bacterium]